MSDLINFNVTNEKVIELASPLIPPPKNSNDDNLADIGSSDNPFDLVMKKVIEFEKNKDDPFETVCHKVMRCHDKVLVESEENLILKCEVDRTFNETKTNVEKESREPFKMKKYMSKSVELSTRLEKNGIAEKKNLASDNCDMYEIPSLKISPTPCLNDLSILSNSSMNDSLLDLYSKKDVKNFDLDFKARHKSETDFLPPKEPVFLKNYRRSMSVTESSTNSILKENSINYNIHLNFNDPFDKALRKNSMGNSSTFMNFDSSYSFNKSPSEMSLKKQNNERFNSDSSVFSLSNISSIPSDSSNKQIKKRFSHDSSSLHSISNLSMIPSNNYSSYSSIFSNDTMNKGFVSTETGLSSMNSSEKKCKDIEKLYEIKTKLITEPNESQIVPKMESLKTNSVSLASENHGKLVEIDETNNSVFSSLSTVDNIISNEALVLAQTFEKMAVNPEYQSNLNSDDSLLSSEIQLKFDELPPSDDENVDVLIDLPYSPEHKINLIVEPTDNNKLVQDIKEFEIEKKDPDKKAEATLLLLNLETLLKENENPNSYKILDELQNVLGIECKNNTEILQACLPSKVNVTQSNEKSECNNVSNESSIAEPEFMNKKFNGRDCTNNSLNSSKSQSNEKVTLNKTKETENLVLKNNDLNYVELDNTKKSSDFTESKNLAKNLLDTLNKIVIENDSNSAVQLVKNLSSVLKLATSEKNKATSTPALRKRESTSKFNRSIPLCSPNRVSAGVSTPRLQEKRKSIISNMRKLSLSNPELNKSAFQTNQEKNSQLVNSRPSFVKSTTVTVDPIKSKLKKTCSEVGKKGPLKAVIPVGNMQKLKVNSSRYSFNTAAKTPAKLLNSKSSMKLVSSTPNEFLKKLESKPLASSTLAVNNAGRPSRVETTPKKLKQNESPKIESCTPKKDSRRTSRDSYLPKYSPRPNKLRTHSISDLRSIKSPPSINTSFGSSKLTNDLRNIKSPQTISNTKSLNIQRSMTDSRILKSPSTLSSFGSIKSLHSTNNLRKIKSPQVSSNLKSVMTPKPTSDLRSKRSPLKASGLKGAKSPLSSNFNKKIMSEDSIERSALSPLKSVNKHVDKEKLSNLPKRGKLFTNEISLGKENYLQL